MKTPFDVYSLPSNNHIFGKKKSIKKYVEIKTKKADKNSPVFKALWGLPPSLTRTKKVPIIDMIIPVAAMNNGKITALISLP